MVKLPGAGPDQPNVYEFGTTFEEMYRDLTSKDPQLYPFSGFVTWVHLLVHFEAVAELVGDVSNRILEICCMCVIVTF